MEPRKIILLLIALLIAGGTAMLARSMMQPQEAATQQEKKVVVEKPVIVEIAVAARDLPAGTILKDVDIKWSPLAAGAAAPADAFVKGKTEMSALTGGVVRKGIRAEMQLTPERVVPKGDKGFMAAVLNPGMRAVSVSMTPVAGVAGFLFPGDHVDVIVTHQINKGSADLQTGGHRVSETVLTNVRVLALDQRADDQSADPKLAQVATLEVTPKQAETIALMHEIGTISLALRSQQNGPDDVPTLAADPNAPAAPATAAAMTWDSDVSQVLEKPANRKGAIQRVQVMRGKDTSETIFGLKQ